MERRRPTGGGGDLEEDGSGGGGGGGRQNGGYMRLPAYDEVEDLKRTDGHHPEKWKREGEEEGTRGSEGEGGAEVEYRTTWWRWWVLFIFSFASFNQSLIWFTFSSVPSVVKEYYPGVDESDIDLLLNWGAIIFIPVLPYVSWLQTRPNGLINAFWQGNVLVFVAAVIRTIPCWTPDHLRGNFYMQWTLHIGQILNAAAGPIVIALCSKLSAVWFPDNQRATATAIGYTANAFGTSIGFLIGPAIAKSANDLPTLLYVEIGFAALPIIGGIIYYRERPRYPPSAVALAHIEGRYESNFLKGVKDSLFNVSFLLAIFAGGVSAGVTNGWQGVLPQSLENLDYSESEAGWLGFAGSLAGIVGGMAIGPVMDHFFQRRCKLLLLLVLGGAVLSFTWLTLSLPTPFFDQIIPSNFWVLVIALVISGFFQGAIAPVIYELSAELLYPVPEATSGGLMTLLINIATLVVLFVSPLIETNWMNTIQTATMLGCYILVVFIVERYKRWEAEVVIYRERTHTLNLQGD